MSDSLFRTMQAEVEAMASAPLPPRPEMFMVLACHDGRWTVPYRLAGMLFLTREAAEEAGKKLASCWQHRRIVRIPGE